MSHVVAIKTTRNVFPSRPFNEFPDEFNERLLHDARGMLIMANSGKNTNKSQFFFTLKPCPHLNRKHAVLGRVVGGHTVLDRLDKHGEHLAEEAKIHGKARSDPIKIITAVTIKEPVSEVDTSLLMRVQTQVNTRKKKGKPPSPAQGSVSGVGKYLAQRGGTAPRGGRGPIASSNVATIVYDCPPKKKVKMNWYMFHNL